MGDENNNGIDDNVERAIERYSGENRRINLDLRSLVAGALLGIALGAGTLTVAQKIWPDSDIIRGIGAYFIGGLADDLKTELEHYKEAWACIEGGAAVQGTDISVCAAKLEVDDE